MRSGSNVLKETLRSLTDIEKILIVDVETTGLKKDSEIIQFSAIGYHLFPNGSIREEERINYYINPKQKIPIQVQKLTGLDNRFLSRMEDEETVFPLIHQFLCRNQGSLLAGYCVDFDIRMIRSMYLRQHVEFPEFVSLDVKKMAKDILLPDGLENYKLKTCLEHLGLDRGIQFHSAIDDVYATGLLLEFCLKHYLTVVADERPAELEAKVINAKYFVNPQKKSMRRLIVYTSLGEIYYDAVNKGWGIKNNSEMARSTFDRLDLDKIEADLLQRYRYPSLDALIRKMEFLYRNNS